MYRLSCSHTFWLQSEVDGPMDQLLDSAQMSLQRTHLKSSWGKFEAELRRGYLRVKKSPATRPNADIIPVNTSWKAFSERACCELGAALTDSGELLPVHSEVGTYFLFNPQRTVAQILDLERTKTATGTRLKPPYVHISGQMYFRGTVPQSESLFVLSESPLRPGLLASESFRAAVLAAKLKGFEFGELHAGVGYS